MVLTNRDRVNHIALGSASQGPILLGATDGVFHGEMVFVDLQTLKVLPLEMVGRGAVHVGEDAPLRASSDGKVFGMFKYDQSPQYVQSVVLEGNRARIHASGASVGHVTPGPDGRYLYTARGVYTQEAKPLGKEEDGLYCLPAVQGPYYLGLKLSGWPGKTTAVVTLHLAGDNRPLLTLPDLVLPDEMSQWDRERFATDRRIHLIPDARLLITIPSSNDRLVLHRLDLDRALEKADVDYLFVNSLPPVEAHKGKLFTYQMTVKSRKGGVKYRLDSGPPGLEVTGEGQVRWPVPADLAEKVATVIVSVSDRSGQEVFHTFDLNVQP